MVIWIFNKFHSESSKHAEPAPIDDINKVTLNFDFDIKKNDDDDESFFTDMNIYMKINDTINSNSTPQNGNFIQNSH